MILAEMDDEHGIYVDEVCLLQLVFMFNFLNRLEHHPDSNHEYRQVQDCRKVPVTWVYSASL